MPTHIGDLKAFGGNTQQEFPYFGSLEF